jgi:hypothetical protein
MDLVGLREIRVKHRLVVTATYKRSATSQSNSLQAHIILTADVTRSSRTILATCCAVADGGVWGGLDEGKLDVDGVAI